MPRPLQPATQLRRQVIARSLFAPSRLAAAVARLGFVQADPIRSPARAQDLILRHRVVGYRAGDLDRDYPTLGLDEDYLYAYGFATPATRRLLHPGAAEPPAGLTREVLAYVRATGSVHPREVDLHFAAGAERNAWGGQSRATTRALERLRAFGLLRVVRREAGVRVYGAVEDGVRMAASDLALDERLRGLVQLLVAIFAPLPEDALRRVLRYVPHIRRHVPAPAMRQTLASMARAGELLTSVVDGELWTWPADAEPAAAVAVPRAVRLLAPFDPVVWDRARFERLWGWAYRFEAYTPAAQRARGYYALPVLWGDTMVGWANVSRPAPGASLDVSVGFAGERPRGPGFTRALDAEIARLEIFLRPRARARSGDGGDAGDVGYGAASGQP